MKMRLKMRKSKRIAIGALSLTMAAALAASQVVAFANKSNVVSGGISNVREISFDNLTGSIDLSDIS